MTKHTQGRSVTGVALTEEELERLAAVAEAGLEVDRLRPRGRPRLGDGPSTSLPVRLDPALRQALTERAVADNTTPSEVVRAALRIHLGTGVRARRSSRIHTGGRTTGGRVANEKTGRKAASNAGKTLGAKAGSRSAKSAAGSALSQTGTSRVTGKKAASNAGKTLRSAKTTKASKSAAGSALTQKPAKKSSSKKSAK